MKKLALKAIGMLALGALSSCGGGWTSTLSHTSWTSTTVVPQAMANGVTATTWTLNFATATTQTPDPSGMGGTSTGPMTYTYAETYGATASSGYQGCVITATCTGTYFETAIQPATGSNSSMGNVYGSGTTCTCVAASCMDTTVNGPFTSGCSLYSDTGGEEQWSIAAGALTLTAGDSIAPYYGTGANYTFATAPAM